MTNRKNPAAVALGRIGGSKKSPAKTRAARLNILKRWEAARRNGRKSKGPKRKVPNLAKVSPGKLICADEFHKYEKAVTAKRSKG